MDVLVACAVVAAVASVGISIGGLLKMRPSAKSAIRSLERAQLASAEVDAAISRFQVDVAGISSSEHKPHQVLKIYLGDSPIPLSFVPTWTAKGLTYVPASAVWVKEQEARLLRPTSAYGSVSHGDLDFLKDSYVTKHGHDAEVAVLLDALDFDIGVSKGVGVKKLRAPVRGVHGVIDYRHPVAS